MENNYLKKTLRELKKTILKEKAFRDFFNFEDKINLIKLNDLYSNCLYSISKDILDEKKVLEKELSTLNNKKISIDFSCYVQHYVSGNKELEINLNYQKDYFCNLTVSDSSPIAFEIYDDKEKKYYITWSPDYESRIKDIDEEIHRKIVNLGVKIKFFLDSTEEFTYYYVTKHIDDNIDYNIKIKFQHYILTDENKKIEYFNKYMIKIKFFNIKHEDAFSKKEPLLRFNEESIILEFDIEKNYLTGKYIYSKNGSGSIYGHIDEKIEIKNMDILYSLLHLIKIPKKDLPNILLEQSESSLIEEMTSEEDNLENQLIEKEIEENNKKIEELFSKNKELMEKLHRRLPILSTQLFKEVEKNGEKYYIINYEYKYILRNYDLSKISFDNVDIRGIDFRGTNINSSLFDLQKVHNKDASNCNFSTDEDNAKDYIFGYDTDFTGVNLSGTDMSNPYPILLNSTINKAYIDEFTILPEFYQDKVKKKSLW